MGWEVRVMCDVIPDEEVRVGWDVCDEEIDEEVLM